MGKLIVISGLPASGKSTLIRRLKTKYNITTVPEHNEWIKGKFPKTPNNIDEKIKKQQFFLDLDIERYKWSLIHKKDVDFIISDTDFTSPLAHNYAERWLFPELNIYDWMVEEYSKRIRMNDLGIADYYIFLDLSFNERIKRREHDFNTTGRLRNNLFFTEPFPTDMRNFYYIMMNKESGRKCLPATWYANTKNENETESDIWEIINLSLNHNGKDYEEQFLKGLRNSIKDKQW